MIRRIIKASFVTFLAALLIIEFAAWGLNHFTAWKIVFNVTPSVPRGLYLVHTGTLPTKRGQLIVFEYSNPQWAVRQGVSARDRYIKYVGALPGDRLRITSEGHAIDLCKATAPVTCRTIGIRLHQHTDGLVFPPLHLPIQVPQGKFYAMSPISDAWDSRYYGLVSLKDVIGNATPILVWKGQYHYRLG